MERSSHEEPQKATRVCAIPPPGVRGGTAKILSKASPSSDRIRHDEEISARVLGVCVKCARSMLQTEKSARATNGK